jgi:predicted nucleotidyltransferase
MTRDHVLSALHGHLHEIQARFGVKRLTLFGSAARDDMRSGSDVDVLVQFEGRPTFDGYMDLKAYLEDLLGASVDLVTEKALKPRMRPIVEKDMVHVA